MSNGILNLKKMISVYLQINEINSLLTKSIKENGSQKDQLYYLINKDIISFYLNSEQLKEYTKNQTLGDLGAVFEKVNNNQNIKCEIPENINMFLKDIEKLKIENKELLYNFFIVREDVLEILLSKSNKDNNDEENDNNDIITGFTQYNIRIGTEGIYIWKKENKENEEIVVYFLDVGKLETNLKTFRVKRIYIFENEKVFKKELKNNIIGKSINDYISSKNIFNSKSGIFNLIDNGEIIGSYINIMMGENFHDEDINEDSNKNSIKDKNISHNKDNNISDNKDNNNSISNKEDEKIKSRFDSFVENIEKNIDEFLTAFLVNCYYIEDLRQEITNSTDKNDTLTSKLKEFFFKFQENKDCEVQINNLLKLIKARFSEELPQFNSMKILNDIIIKIMDIIYEENESNQIILELFYGDKNYIDERTKNILFSSTIKEIKELDDSKLLYNCPLPKILVLNGDVSEKKDLEFYSLQYFNNYDLISSIQETESGFASIIIKENNYEKIVYQKGEKKYKVSSIENTDIQDEKKRTKFSIFKRNLQRKKEEYQELSGQTMIKLNISKTKY